MAITFNEIPRDLLIPGGYIEFDPSRAGTSGDQATVLIIGQKTALGEADIDRIYDIGSEQDAIRLFADASMLQVMISLYLKYNFGIKIQAVAVKVEGTLAQWPLLFSDATTAGTAGIVIAGYEVNIAVGSDDVATDIATKMAEKVNSIELPVTASVEDDVLTLTALHAGTTSNDIAIEEAEDTLNVFAIGERTEGTGKPDLASMIENMADDSYDYIVNPYTDSSNLSKLQTECDRRWHAMVAMESHVFMSGNDDYTAALDFTENQNSSHFTYLPIAETPQPAYIWTTVLAAIATGLLRNDPAAPLTDKALPELIPGKSFAGREKNDLLHNGASTYNVVAGKVYISYLVTMHRINAQGKSDTAYRDIQVPEILKNLRRIQIFEAMKTYSGYKIAKDVKKYAAGQRIIDTDEVKGFLYGLYRDRFMREYGWVQDDEGYLDELIVEISPDNNDHIYFQDRPRLIGQFRVLAGRTQFIDK